MRVEPTNNPPWFRDALMSRDPRELTDYVRKLITWLIRTYESIARAVNHNEVHITPTAVQQTTRPTPGVGELVVWKNTAATTGQSTHYLVVNEGGTVVTFASVEKVP